MAELVLMSDIALERVRDFSIEHPGCGRIDWLEPVDLRGIDLDQVIRLEQGLAEVYDRCPVPPRGQKLNGPARVSLYGIHETDRDTGLPLRDEAIQRRYEEGIRRATAKQGAELVNYDYTSGVWTFQVDHFA